MNTLTGIEAERVSQILKHVIDRLRVLSYVPTEWDDKLMEDVPSPAIQTSLERLWVAEEELRVIGDSMGEQGGGNTKKHGVYILFLVVLMYVTSCFNLYLMFGNIQFAFCRIQHEGGRDIAVLKQTHRASKNLSRNLMAERASLQVRVQMICNLHP